jgi:exodeoxyribonuclease-3
MLKLYSWNVNGIRAVVNKGTWDNFLQQEKPDIICLQEIKAKEEQILLPKNNYFTYWHSAEKAGYSGVGILSKTKPLKIINGLPEDIIQSFNVANDTYGNPNQEGRVITAEYANFWLVNVYTPNAKNDLSRLNLRHAHWDPAFLAYLLQLEKTKPVITCGDLNVAHTSDDLANPKTNIGKKGFTNEERQDFQAYIDAGFIDSFRIFHQGNGYYTWWSHFAKARERNVGWRIDYFITSLNLKQKIEDASIHSSILGSDHCPISLSINL